MAKDLGKYKPESLEPKGLTSKQIIKGNKPSTQSEFEAASKQVMGKPVSESSLPGQNPEPAKKGSGWSRSK